MMPCVALFLLASIAQATPPEAATNRALIIAVGDYDDSSGWQDLSSANDAELIRHVLEQRGFASERVRTLADSAATAEGILAAFDALAEETQPGDTVVVHYSGHGYKVADDNGDEQDGVDELLVAHDAEPSYRVEAGAELRGYLRDDIVAEKLVALRRAAGPEGHVLLLLDSCFSGTASRGALDGARSQQAQLPEGLPKAPDAHPSGLDHGLPGDDLASLVVISAARYDQEAKEVKASTSGEELVGSLSGAFAQALLEQTGPMSYGALLTRLRHLVRKSVGHHEQEPQMEGNADLDVLKGTGNANGFGIAILEAQENTLVIQQGAAAGLTLGSTVVVHPLTMTVPEPSRAQATGRVVALDALSAVVELDAPAAIKPGRSWAFVTRHLLTLRMNIAEGVDPALLQAIHNEWNVQGGEAHFTLSEEGGGFCLRADADAPCQGESRSEVLNRLRFRAMAGHLRFYDAAPVSDKLVFEWVSEGPDLGADGVLRVCSGTDLRIRFANNGYRNVHYSVTAVDKTGPEGEGQDDLIYALAPRPRQAFEVLQKGGDWVLDKAYTFNGDEYALTMSGEPGDQSFFRLIAHSVDGGNPPRFQDFARLTQSPISRGKVEPADLLEVYGKRLPRFMGTQTLTVEVKACP
jgi:hypothetical protein